VIVAEEGSETVPKIQRNFLLILLTVLIAWQDTAFAQKKQSLDRTYKDWLERDVVYIITKDEKDAFLHLTTDAARDKFIEDFWEIRNPNPGSPVNSYKEDIYQRIAFANARFGIGSGTDGWRTDRGRTYITLGPPQQKQAFRNSANLYPVEIWFYASANPSLPPAFYVMFYQREGSGDYRFYSPFTDGPDKLATGVEAINSRSAALRMIRDSVGPEVARISLSLIPDEPVDESTGTVSLESDILLNSIKNLPNLPANRDEINRRRSSRERVTSRVVLEAQNLDLVTFPARDSRGATRLDYAIRLRNPGDLSVTEENDGKLRYAVEFLVRVFGADNKLIFAQQKSVTDTLTKKGFDGIKDKVFGYLGTLPLPPGKYRLDFQFSDWSKKVTYHTAREVTVPGLERDVLVVPGVLPFLSAESVDPGVADFTPFAMGGVQFVPMTVATPTLSKDTNLQFMYQIWSIPKNPQQLAGKRLSVEYVFGRPAAVGSTTKVEDEIGMDQFNVAGSLVTGKKLSLLEKPSGNYILTVTLRNPETQRTSFSTMNFKVLDAPPPFAPWDVVEPGISEDIEKGVFDQQRALCYWNLGQIGEARLWFRRALQADHANDTARARLVDAYFGKGDYAAVASLYADAGITDNTDPATLLRIASSLQKGGSTPQAISVLETGIKTHPEEGSLYMALASFYKGLGEIKKAEDLEKKGRSYLGQAPVPPLK